MEREQHKSFFFVAGVITLQDTPTGYLQTVNKKTSPPCKDEDVYQIHFPKYQGMVTVIVCEYLAPPGQV